MRRYAIWLTAALAVGCTSAPTLPPAPTAVTTAPPKIALVLGGGAARGFAHVGVIKALDARGIKPDIVVGTSAGAVVGALYAAGYQGTDLQRVALQLEESMIGDWSLPNRGVFKGEALQEFINRAAQGRPIEKLNRVFGVVATDLGSGEQVVFRRGDTGTAVRASSSIPGVFQPVIINGREYVDGGLTSPVPVRAAQRMGAEMIIAVDVSQQPRDGRVGDMLEVMLQTFSIMGRAIAASELPEADVVISPDIAGIGAADFASRQRAIDAGERAALAALPAIREKIAAKSRIVAQ